MVRRQPLPIAASLTILALAVSPLAVVPLATAAAPASRQEGMAAYEKLIRVVTAKMESAETLAFSEAEVNALIEHDPGRQVPDGVRDLRTRILDGAAVAEGYFDLVKLGRRGGASPGLLWSFLLRGERHIEAKCRFTSANGFGTVEVESVRIDGLTISGSMLDWLVANYVNPRLPDFQLGKPFALPHGLREIRLEPQRAVVVAR